MNNISQSPNAPDLNPNVLDQLKEIYTSQSAAASENARKIAFGAAALCWFFKSENLTFPFWVTLALFFLVLYFVLDLMQYFSSAIRYHRKYRRYRNKTSTWETIRRELESADKMPWVLFKLKVGILFIGYIFIAIEIATKWF